MIILPRLCSIRMDSWFYSPTTNISITCAYLNQQISPIKSHPTEFLSLCWIWRKFDTRNNNIHGCVASLHNWNTFSLSLSRRNFLYFSEAWDYLWSSLWLLNFCDKIKFIYEQKEHDKHRKHYDSCWSF